MEGSFLVAGVGGIGNYVAWFLLEHGAQRVGLIDMDTAEVSNLNRQILFQDSDVGQPKALCAKRTLDRLFPGRQISAVAAKLQDMPLSFYAQFDCILAGLDNVDARRYLNNLVYTLHRDHDTHILLVDGGTDTFLGHCRTIVPATRGVCACFECTLAAFSDEHAIPLCSIAQVPRSNKHCVQYAALVQWPDEHGAAEFDPTDPDHAAWLALTTDKLCAHYGFPLLSRQDQIDVLRRTVPAIASTNQTIGCMMVLRAAALLFGHAKTSYVHYNYDVRRVPVYLNRLLEDEGENGGGVYVLQYPLRPVYRPYGDHGRLVQVAKGETSNKLKMSYLLNASQGSEHYDEGKRQLLEQLLETKKAQKRPLSAEEELQLHRLQYHELKSTYNKGDSDYCVGIMHNGAYFLMPVAKVLQLKPDFDYVDREDILLTSADEAKVKRNIEASSAAATPDGELSTMSTPTVDGATPQDRSAGPAPSPAAVVQSRLHVASPGQQRREDLSEVYAPVDTIYDADSPETADIISMFTTFPYKVKHEIAPTDVPMVLMEDLFNEDVDMAPEPASRATAAAPAAEPAKPTYEILTKRGFKPDLIPSVILDDDVEKYYDAICSGCAVSTLAGTTTDVSMTDEAVASGVGVGPLSFLALSRLPVEFQVRRIMAHRQIERFASIKQLVTSSSVADSELVKHLSQCAIPLHGLWVAKSDVHASTTQVSRFYELERMTRDVVLCLFSRKRNVDRAQLKKITQLPSERLNAVLSTIFNVVDGKLVPKIQPAEDAAFMEQYPTLCKEAEEEWSPKKAQDLITKIAEFNASENLKRSQLTGGDAKIVDVLNPTRVKTIVVSCLSRYGASAEEFILEQVKTQLEKDIGKDVSEQLQDQTTGLSKSRYLEQHNAMVEALKNITCSDLRIILLNTSVNVGGLWILKKTGNHSIDPYRALILSKYKLDMEQGLTKKDFQDACLETFKKPCDLPDIQYRAIFKEVAVNIGGRWYFKASKHVQQDREP